MVIDNFDRLANILEFRDGTFYTISLFCRMKDGNEHPREIRHYYVTTKNYLRGHKDEIINLCNQFNARAYMNINPSSFETCAYKMLKELADIIENRSFQKITGLLQSCAAQYTCGRENKRWLLDLDGVMTEENAKPHIELLQSIYASGKGMPNGKIDIIPTVNGCHLLASPFDVKDYHKVFPGIDIFKASPTLLYYNKKEKE